MPNTTVDIVIPTRGRGARVERAIESIRRSTYPDFALWVVDQSDDSTTEAAVSTQCQLDSRVHYVRSDSRGSNRARNEGIRAGSSPYVLFTDDDCRVDQDWVRTMTAELSKVETSAVFGRVLVEHEPRPQLPPDQLVSPSIRLVLKDEPERQEFHGNRFRLGFGHGANMGLRRDAYEAAGGFDLLLGCGGPLRAWPERDLGYRILSRGGRIVYTPDAVVHHSDWRSWDEVRNTVLNYAFGTGAAAGKYLRSGDWGGAYLLVEWLLDQGARQVASGILKWQSRQKIEVGLLQLIYPWVGLWFSLRYPVDSEAQLYRDSPNPPASGTPEGSDDAVAHFSATASQFHALYEGNPEFLDRLARWLPLLDRHVAGAGGKTVDLGCGSGVFSLYAARKGGSVIGVDGAPDMVALCNEQKSQLGLDNARFVQGRLPDIDTDGLEDADVVICSSVLEYVEDLDAALSLLARLTKPGGVVLLSMPNLFCLNRIYERTSYHLLGRSPIYRYIRHFSSPGLLARRVRRHHLWLEHVEFYDHHSRLAALTRRMRLPPLLTEDLFVAVLRKK